MLSFALNITAGAGYRPIVSRFVTLLGQQRGAGWIALGGRYSFSLALVTGCPEAHLHGRLGMIPLGVLVVPGRHGVWRAVVTLRVLPLGDGNGLGAGPGFGRR